MTFVWFLLLPSKNVGRLEVYVCCSIVSHEIFKKLKINFKNLLMSTKDWYSNFNNNKNAVSSIESRLLGDIVVKGGGAVILLFHLEYKTSLICHNINTQKVKLASRDRPHILASNRCETFVNLLHIDIAPLRSTLSGILHSKNWTMIFIGIRGPWLCQYKYT